jgi:hypothetical protein
VQVGEERLREVLEPRGDVSMVCRSTKELTVPVTPKLRTSHRTSTFRCLVKCKLDPSVLFCGHGGPGHADA